MFEVIKDVGSLCGACATILAFIGVCIKPVRKFAVDKIRQIANSDKNNKTIEDMLQLLKNHIEEDKAWKLKAEEMFARSNETDIVQLRNTINNLYDRNFVNKSLSIRDKESLVDLFNRYKQIGGNHNVEQKYNEMMGWEVRPY